MSDPYHEIAAMAEFAEREENIARQNQLHAVTIYWNARATTLRQCLTILEASGSCPSSAASAVPASQ